jgi:hypothetical protein
MKWVFISQKTPLFIVTAVKISNLTLTCTGKMEIVYILPTDGVSVRSIYRVFCTVFPDRE